jgi:hypothetical protein
MRTELAETDIRKIISHHRVDCLHRQSALTDIRNNAEFAITQFCIDDRMGIELKVDTTVYTTVDTTLRRATESRGILGSL